MRLIVRARRPVAGWLPGLRPVSVVLQVAHQIRKPITKSARQSGIGCAHGNVQFAGPFAEAHLNGCLILAGKFERDIAHTCGRSPGFLILRIEELRRTAFGGLHSARVSRLRCGRGPRARSVHPRYLLLRSSR